MADDLYSGGGGDGTVTQSGTVDPSVTGMAGVLSGLVSGRPVHTLTLADFPNIFSPTDDNSGALDTMIKGMTATPEKLAAFTDLIAMLLKFKAA